MGEGIFEGVDIGDSAVRQSLAEALRENLADHAGELNVPEKMTDAEKAAIIWIISTLRTDPKPEYNLLGVAVLKFVDAAAEGEQALRQHAWNLHCLGEKQVYEHPDRYTKQYDAAVEHFVRCNNLRYADWRKLGKEMQWRIHARYTPLPKMPIEQGMLDPELFK